MLKSIRLKNFTVFVDANIQFSPQLNVIVGENGVGKSHLLKVPYAVLAASAEEGRRPNASTPSKGVLQTKLADKLVAVLRPEQLGRLARRRQGHARCEIDCRMNPSKMDLHFHFSTSSHSAVILEKTPAEWVKMSPVFIPTRELLTIYPNFVSVYDNHYLEFEETWRDTCGLLGTPAFRGPREQSIKELLEPLEKVMGGKVELDKSGRFYLKLKVEAGRMEMPLVAEGLRKFAMLAQLIATGSLLDKGSLFWDEPETNLNPKLIAQAARSILQLCGSGIQVFVATHSLFFLRELDILLKYPEFQELKARFIGLQQGAEGVEVLQGASIDDIGPITSLNEELSQSDRYLAEGLSDG